MKEGPQGQGGRSAGNSSRTAKRKKPAKGRTRWGVWLIRLLILTGAGIIAACGLYLYIIVAGQNLLTTNVNKMEMPETSILYDQNGNEIKKLFHENRELVTFDQIPERLRNAFIAVEDKRFEEHSGVDLWAIGRALVKDVMARSAVEGGSTITQQLAKNLYLSHEKTLFRKAKEVSIAVALENNYTKDEILAMYLNQIYFGESAYGVKAAAKTYFGKDDLGELTLGEMAMLAGLPKAPSAYNPIDYPERAIDRRNLVLLLMEQQGYITAEERAEAEAETYSPPPAKEAQAYWGFIDYVLEEAEAKAGIKPEQFYLEGYQVYTTMNLKAQTALERAFANPELFPQAEGEQVQAAATLLDQRTGAVQAMLGGRDYRARSFNRAVAPRQPGSSFKPIVSYAPALELGWEPYSMLKDERMSFGDYQPRNYNNRYLGEVTMAEAIEDSINVPAVWLLNEIGVKNGLDFVKKLGIELDPERDRNLAIALGGLTYGVSPLDMAEAYASFANNGVWNEAYAITKIVDKRGEVIYEHKPVSREVMSEQTAYYMTEMLEGVVKNGTGRNARMDRPVAGKTGSTQIAIDGVTEEANRDVWFVGYTPELTASIWMGFDRTTEENYMVASSGAPAKLFSVIMSEALEGVAAKPFERPEGVSRLNDPPAAPQNFAAEYASELMGVKLSWSAVEGADSYQIHRKAAEEEAFTMLADTAGTEMLDMMLEPGKHYQYYVVAISAKGMLRSGQSTWASVAVPDMDDPFERDPFHGEDGEFDAESPWPSDWEEDWEGEPGHPGEDGGGGADTGDDEERDGGGNGRDGNPGEPGGPDEGNGQNGNQGESGGDGEQTPEPTDPNATPTPPDPSQDPANDGTFELWPGL